MKDPKQLAMVQDTVWNDTRWKPHFENGVEVTHCNQASLAVANGLGCHDFDPPKGGEPYSADELFWFFQRKDNSGKWLEKNMEDVQTLANQGSLVFAVLDSHAMQEHHGHIVSITPGEMIESGELNKQVPVCLNVAGAKLSGRKVELTEAFPMRHCTPRFFAWKELL